ncbi:MAG: BrnA antitoxin family protein [Nitrococcus sp.]|nr:BrnA antitoxin family protein [Nitrococcus sp.]
MTDEFQNAKRGPVIASDPNKVRVTIRLDADIIEHFKRLVHEAGGGNYQTLINEAPRGHINDGHGELANRLRKIIREELRKVG